MAVTGGILTVELRYRNTANAYVAATVSLDQVNLTNDATARRYGILKDQSGTYLAAPLNSFNKKVAMVTVAPGKSEVACSSFPPRLSKRPQCR